MKRFPFVIACFLMVFFTACQSATANTIPEKNASYDSYLYGITFQHPREWQIGYGCDSGACVLMISDTDPIEVFGLANRAGNEIVMSLWGGEDANSDFDPVEFLEKLGKGPITSEIHEFKAKDKHVAYVLNSGEVRAAMVSQQKAFWFDGDYPVEKELAVREGLESILRSLESTNIEGWELSLPMGQRDEGPLKIDQMRDGYIPSWSTSVWTLQGKAGQAIRVSINPGDADAQLTLDILDKDERSIFSGGALSFIGEYDSDQIHLPVTGSYIIQVSSQPIRRTWYGWYKITLK